MDTEEAPSTPVTPGTPGAPLFGGHKGNHHGSENGKRSLLKSCISFNVDDWGTDEGGLAKVSCSLPPPPVSLARKVTLEKESILVAKVQNFKLTRILF